jgi:hypothetical protein
VAAAALKVRQRPFAASANGSSRPICGLTAMKPMQAPASTALVGHKETAASTATASQAPVWPLNRLAVRNGKAEHAGEHGPMQMLASRGRLIGLQRRQGPPD